MGIPAFEHELRYAEKVLESLQREAESSDLSLYRNHASAGIKRAREELVKMRRNLHWHDEELPF